MINLWELMLSTSTNEYCVPEYKRLRLMKACADLARASYVAGQEFSIEAIEEGWLIKVFSCHDDRWEINILITKTGKVDLSVGRFEFADRKVDGSTVQ